MIEYIYDAIRATAGSDIIIAAEITEDNGECITEGCTLILYIDEKMLEYNGALNNGMWEFIIPASATSGLKGRYWYCIKHNGNQLCFKQPIYLV